ncbi:hypothetical protein HZS_3335, partial [Henneguya salminicola]
ALIAEKSWLCELRGDADKIILNTIQWLIRTPCCVGKDRYLVNETKLRQRKLNGAIEWKGLDGFRYIGELEKKVFLSKLKSERLKPCFLYTLVIFPCTPLFTPIYERRMGMSSLRSNSRSSTNTTGDLNNTIKYHIKHRNRSNNKHS